MAEKRPLGVTVICVLGFLGALFWIAGGAMAVMGGAALGVIGAAPALGLVASATGIVTAIIGVILLLAFFWTWNLMKKGWTLVMIMEIIGLILSLISMNIVGIVLALVIAGYLYMNKSLFK
jgi:hypothetical protein